MYHTKRLLQLLYISVGAMLFSAGCGSVDEAQDGRDEASDQRTSPIFARNTVAPEEADQYVDEAESAYQAQVVGDGLRIPAPLSSAATNDGRVYNVTAAVNIRSCPSTSCSVLRVAYAGADLENDGNAGKTYSNGYYWIRVVYGYGSTAPCDTTQYKGWMIVDPLSPGPVHVTLGPLNIRSSPCNGSILQTVPTGTTLAWYQGNNQWSSKWYEIVVPGTFQSGWVEGWDYTDVY